MSDYHSKRATNFLTILGDCGQKVCKDTVILDFGCGGGHIVQALRELGYQAYGCDVAVREDLSHDKKSTNRLYDSDILRLIEPENKSIPFEDSMFDIVISDQVFEHVQDYEAAIREIGRVMKVDGQALHLFPSRYKFIEPHVNMPLATLVQARWWVAIWAMFGLPKGHKELNWHDSINKSYSFLDGRTNYLPKKKIKYNFSKYFHTVQFCEKSFIANSQNKYLNNIPSSFLPAAGSIYSTLRGRVVFTKNPIK